MGRGVSAGGGQSSLGYLFGSGEEPKPAAKDPKPTTTEPKPATDKAEAPVNQGLDTNNAPSQKSTAAEPSDATKQIPAGIHGSTQNNYFRADGQNCGNFLTDRPSTKVHAAPGGGSSLGYLFGDGGK